MLVMRQELAIAHMLVMRQELAIALSIHAM